MKHHLNNWTSVRLGEVVEINPRQEIEARDDDTLASFVPMKCVEEESGRFESLGDRKVKDVRKGYTPFRDGDVLFAKVTPCMENGKAAIVRGLTNGIGFGSTELFALRPASDLHQKFLFYFITQESFRRSAAANMTGAVGLRRVPRSYLAEQLIPLPPLPTQRRIVAEIEKQFTRLDAGVAALRRTQANLKRYRAAVLKAACEGGLVPTEAELARKEALFGGSIPNQDFGSPSHGSNPSRNRDSIPHKEVQRSTLIGSTTYETGEQLLARILVERRKTWRGRGKYKEPVFPDNRKIIQHPIGWTLATVDQLCSLVTDGDHNPPKRHENGLPHLTAKNVRNWRLDEKGCTFISIIDAERVLKRYNPLANDLIVTCVGTVGRTAIVPPNFKFSPDRNLAAVRLVVGGASTRYLNFVLSSPIHQEIIKGASGSTAQPHLYLGDLRAIIVPLPPLAEQTRIVTEMERRLSVIDELESVVAANIQRATRLRQSILQQAFSGALLID